MSQQKKICWKQRCKVLYDKENKMVIKKSHGGSSLWYKAVKVYKRGKPKCNTCLSPLIVTANLKDTTIIQQKPPICTLQCHYEDYEQWRSSREMS